MRFPDKRIAFPFLAIGLALAVSTTGSSACAAAAPSSPPTTDANITRLTTSLLENSQFAHHPFDDRAGQHLPGSLPRFARRRAVALPPDGRGRVRGLPRHPRPGHPRRGGHQRGAGHLPPVPAAPAAARCLRHRHPSDGAVRLLGTRRLLPRSRACAAATRPGGGQRPLAAGAEGGILAGEADRQAAGADRDRRSPTDTRSSCRR